jgi:hypothetical protein
MARRIYIGKSKMDVFIVPFLHYGMSLIIREAKIHSGVDFQWAK